MGALEKVRLLGILEDFTGLLHVRNSRKPGEHFNQVNSPGSVPCMGSWGRRLALCNFATSRCFPLGERRRHAAIGWALVTCLPSG
jgi:hypothetical protein